MQTVFFILTLPCYILTASPIILNKCCSLKHGFNSMITCGEEPPSTDEEFEAKDRASRGIFERQLSSADGEAEDLTNLNLTWFPQEAFLDATSLQPLNEEARTSVMEWLVEVAQVRLNALPTCEPPQLPEFTLFAEDNEFFHIVADRERRLRLYMAPPDGEGASGNASLDNKWLLLPLADVCIDEISGVGHALAYCPTMTIVRKCCLFRQWLNAETMECEPIPKQYTDWEPHENVTRPSIIAGRKPQCQSLTVLRIREAELTFHANGSVKTIHNLYETDQYCGEKTWHPDDHVVHQNILFCASQGYKSEGKISSTMPLFIYTCVILLYYVSCLT